MRRFFAVLLILVVLPLSASPQFLGLTNMGDEGDEELKKFELFHYYLNALYIDSLDNQELIDHAISSVLSELDPYSRYIPREELQEMREAFDGKFSGIGVQISSMFDSLHVLNVISGGPSEKVGLIPNDRIVTVDNKNIVGMKQAEAVKLLRGPKDSYVNIEVVRRGVDKHINFRIKRDDIKIESVDASFMIEPEIGYIRLTRFAQTSTDEFKEALRNLEDAKSLIVDLRSNGGGLMGPSIEISNFFLPKGTTITSTEGRTTPSNVFKANNNPIFPEGKVVVLIDEFSASASEIVAGALQDWDRAVIVGRRSFGKGLVQRQLPFQDGSAVNITIARYLTPTGRAIQRPFEKGEEEEYYEDFYKRFEEGFVDSLDTLDTRKYETLFLGKTVYGGGGIYPDYYIDVDTTEHSDYLLNLVRNGVIAEFAHTYLDDHRDELNSQFNSFDDFNKGFIVDDEILEPLLKLAEEREIEFNEEEFERSRPNIVRRLKGIVASTIYGTSEGLQVLQEKDKAIEKALDIIHNWEKEAEGVALTSVMDRYKFR